MVDKERRKKLALHLRHLSVGLITNDEFEDRVMTDVSFGRLPEHYRPMQVDDAVIEPMLIQCWSLYSDLKQHKLQGAHQLNDEQLKIIARFILFLHSDLEYEHEHFNYENPWLRLSFPDLLLALITFGYHKRDYRRQLWLEGERMRDLLYSGYWPFLSESDYENQLKHQPFLNGVKQ